jgi:hypothetical protein
MPGNLQLCSERREGDEFAAALERHDEQEIKTARPSSTLPRAMIRFTIPLSLCIRISPWQVSDTPANLSERVFRNL